MQLYIYSFSLILLINIVTCEGHSINKNGEIIYRTNTISNLYAKSPIGFEHKLNTHRHRVSKPTTITKSNSEPVNVSFTEPLNVGDNKKNTGIMENVIESQIVAIKDPFNITHQELIIAKPHRGNVIDWFLGVVGIRPPETSPGTPVAKDCPTCTCGRVFKHKRIVGGIETVINGYPWMAALMYNNRFYCGGSLINNKYVLTAAHCVNGFSRERLSVVFLDHDRSTSSETKTETRTIKNVYRHSSYGFGGNYNNDIALLQLDREVSITGMLKPVCLPTLGKSFTGYEGIAVGWGATKEHGSISNKLQEVTVPIISNIDCRKTGYGQRITDNMLCAGYPQGMKDSCQGDSGGPLHIVNGTIHHVVGIVSWGEGCAKPNYPGVYTRVNRYISWIKSNTRDACYCYH